MVLYGFRGMCNGMLHLLEASNFFFTLSAAFLIYALVAEYLDPSQFLTVLVVNIYLVYTR